MRRLTKEQVRDLVLFRRLVGRYRPDLTAAVLERIARKKIEARLAKAQSDLAIAKAMGERDGSG